MAVVKIHVVYSDGRTEEIIASPKAQVMTEQHFGGITPQNKLEAHYYLSWLSLHRAGKEAADFNAWLESIDDAETIDEEERVDPTGPAPSPDDLSA
ncbi:MAG TPA: hypothetical protein VGJ44_27690 [Kribbellaceae bacterium]|jgi:hypothetical protein